MSLTTTEMAILAALALVFENEFPDVTLEELGVDCEEKQRKILKAIESNELFMQMDNDGFLKEELVKIFKEIVDKID